MTEKPAVRTITVQVPVDLADQLQALADEHDRTFSAEVRRGLRAHVDAEAAERQEQVA